MQRVRSPGYPSCSLKQAIEFSSQLYDKVRRNALDRESAVREMGYSGLTGASSKTLSNISHYGLIDSTGKGMIRVSDLAVRILHPKDDAERRAALYEAAFAPELFGEIRTAYPDGFVPGSVLENYLKREGFAEAAVGPAVRSYLDTYSFLQQSGATESHGGDESETLQQGSIEQKNEPKTMIYPSNQLAPVGPKGPPTEFYQRGERLPAGPGPSPTSIQVVTADPPINQPNFSFRGDQLLRIDALLDFEGILELEAKIKAFKMLIKPKAPVPPVLPAENDSGDGWEDPPKLIP